MGASRQERIQERARARAARIAARAAARAIANGGIEAPPPAAGEVAALQPAGTPFSSVDGQPIWMHQIGQGAACFLVLTGPSLRTLDLSLLRRRGVFTISVNNGPAIFRPNLWTFVDPPQKFHESIWLDPAILKSVPLRGQILHRQLRRKLPDGTFEPLTRVSDRGEKQILTPAHMPGVICHARSGDFDPERFLSEPTICWGNSKRSAARNKHPRSLCVMLAALKHAWALGFRVVYLLGCDFHMRPEQPYAFRETKQAGGVQANNDLYANVARMLEILKPHFDAANFKIFNCNPESALTVFPHVPYLEAIDAATGHIPQDPLDCDGYYQKN